MYLSLSLGAGHGEAQRARVSNSDPHEGEGDTSSKGTTGPPSRDVYQFIFEKATRADENHNSLLCFG